MVLSKPSRRQVLATLAPLGLFLQTATAERGSRGTGACDSGRWILPGRGGWKLSAEDEQFLNEVEQASFRFFWEQASPETGLVKDRSRWSGSDPRRIASIAATGFGLTALCIADHRRFLSDSDIRKRVLAALHFLWERAHHEAGFFYHWLDVQTGRREWQSEISSIDSAILFCGVLACRAHFADGEIPRLAAQICERADWPWMLAGGSTLCHGWKPETGFLRSRWDSYSELMMMYLLGLGSPTHPLPAETWDAWARPHFEYAGCPYVGSNAPLFVHQYSQAWFDFRGRRDRYADYFLNSVRATDAHRHFCLELAGKFPQYSESLWGITASDSARGYVVWGGPPATGPIDGTIVPAAAGGSLPFLPRECLRVLRTIRRRFGRQAWTRYGFVDAFNPHTGWFDPDVIGIDTGITLLMAENTRSGFVWDTFMKNAEVRRGMERAGLEPYEPPSTPPVGPWSQLPAMLTAQ